MPPGPLPNVPTLVIDGAADIRTPLEDAAQVKSLIPDAQMLAVPYTGHSALASDLSDEGCAVRAVRQFFVGETVTPCAPSANPFSPTPVAPTKFSRLKATGRGGKIGRTITAALATAQDMRRQIIGDALEAGRLPSRAGGLRGGRVVVRNEILTLFNVVYVPGVKVSGTVPLSGSGRQRLTIGGSKSAHGKISVTPSTITGAIGGRKISLVAGAASAGTTQLDANYQQAPASLQAAHRRPLAFGAMPNALAGETSPYLLQHRDNPVDWLPWGEQALSRAKRARPPAARLDRLLGVPLVPRHGARVLRGRRDRRAHERATSSA